MAGGEPACFRSQTSAGRVFPKTVRQAGDAIEVAFEDGSTAHFQVHREPGVALFRLVAFAPRGHVKRFQLFRLDAPLPAHVGGTLNAAFSGQYAAAVMAAEPNVNAAPASFESSRADRPGCSHVFASTDQSKVGHAAARFAATSDSKAGGWSVQGRPWKTAIDLTRCKAIRAWVHGDALNEQLKVQLFDGAGGYRDDYIPIDFIGWRLVTLTSPALNTLHYDHVTALNLYYNGLPQNRTVTCLIDQIEAVIDRAGRTQTVTLEDFEDRDSLFWAWPVNSLVVSTVNEHGLTPAGFGVIVARANEFLKTVERFEQVAGLPGPRLGGSWNKTAPAIKRSYLFLTDLHESELEQALALAHRGGFAMVLLGQESWSRGTGHYEIDRGPFPGGTGRPEAHDRPVPPGRIPGRSSLSGSVDLPSGFLHHSRSRSATGNRRDHHSCLRRR